MTVNDFVSLLKERFGEHAEVTFEKMSAGFEDSRRDKYVMTIGMYIDDKISPLD